MKTKSTSARAIRRVVTGTNQRGQSVVLKDGAATNDHQNLGISRYFTDLWVWNESPAPLTGNGQDGDGPYNFPSPPNGGHLRIVEWPARPVDYDPTTDPERVEVHEPRIRPPGRTWDRGGNNAYTSAIHKTETLDYGIVLTGEVQFGRRTDPLLAIRAPTENRSSTELEKFRQMSGDTSRKRQLKEEET